MSLVQCRLVALLASRFMVLGFFCYYRIWGVIRLGAIMFFGDYKEFRLDIWIFVVWETLIALDSSLVYIYMLHRCKFSKRYSNFNIALSTLEITIE